MSLTFLENIGLLLTLEGAARKGGRRVQEEDLGLQKNHSLIFSGEKILWVGPHRKIPKEFRQKKMKSISARDWTVLPGLVESHTHALFAGSRSAEFEMRLRGKSYQEIAAAGGGILSTVRATRQESLRGLVQKTQERVDHFRRQGVTTLEIKTGYALDEKNELKCLKAIRSLEGPRIVSTFLGAHAIPSEFKNENDYLNHLREKIFPRLKNRKNPLADRIDIFIEKGFFSAEAAKKYLEAATALGIPTTIHADQLTLSGGTELAVQLKSLSADHVLQISDREISLLAKSEVTAGLLPVADIYMKCPFPPARKMIDQGVRVALATDFNPGTAPSMDVSLVGLVARLEMGMSLPEVLSAYTVGAAHALGLQNEIGSLSAGKSADFICTKVEWTDLFYSPGQIFAEHSYVRGKKLS